MPPRKSIDDGLRALTSDDELREMCFAPQKNDGVVDVYFEHEVSTLELLTGKEVVIWLDDTHEYPGEGDLVSKKNTSEGPKVDGNTSNPTTEPNTELVSFSNPSHTDTNANTSTINNPIPNPPEPTLTLFIVPLMLTQPLIQILLRLMTKPILKPNSNPKPKPKSTNKGKEALHVDLTVNDDSSDDDSFEDSSFKPTQEDSSSSKDNASAESDSVNFWHSEEMKTPPNSEDELQSDEDSDEFSIFRNGAKFSKLKLQVGMKFNTKYEFKEVVREYTIQEGRRIKFKKNDNIRYRAICKVKECAWVVYASRDCDDSCWQIKTFNNDHTCARENTNRAANRAWLASKLVKKAFHVFMPVLRLIVTNCVLWRHTIRLMPITLTLFLANHCGRNLCTLSHRPPNIRRRPGDLTKKGRKDADEGNGGNKKAKPSEKLKRHLKLFTCRYCGVKWHTKRGCSKKRLDEVAAGVAAAKAAANKAKSNATASTSRAGLQPNAAAALVDNPPTMEIEISQPNYEGSQDIVGAAAPAPSRPEKLHTKRRSSPPPQSISLDPMQGASVATSSRLDSFLKFVPTLGFQAPRKKNN
ncbi:hypothetical protein Ahy_A01g002786 [Arachis hypogaea]|uniref:Transposase MuDR plant domain-containing protein n=1 Tax=Arachis hypogaea TaxID=3818 RepID=A0A445ERR2_ARAHY|nr:hypothetical protein Ahy_A01g002786 [Arachis hypogaea]